MIEQIRLHRNQLENHLREITSLKAYTDNILSSMTNGLITIDLEERIVTVNERAEQILGKRREEMMASRSIRSFGNHHSSSPDDG